MRFRLATLIVVAVVGLTLVAGFIVGAQRDDLSGPVDLLVYNGKVYRAGGSTAFGQAVAIRGNKILRVGTNAALKRLAGRATRVIDAHGGTVLPGFADSHLHLISGGLGLRKADLSAATNVEQVQQAIRAFASANPAATWVVGRGWTYTMFP
jgi:predicted amidohydrolase YtcJ